MTALLNLQQAGEVWAATTQGNGNDGLPPLCQCHDKHRTQTIFIGLTRFFSDCPSSATCKRAEAFMSRHYLEAKLPTSLSMSVPWYRQQQPQQLLVPSLPSPGIAAVESIATSHNSCCFMGSSTGPLITLILTTCS